MVPRCEDRSAIESLAASARGGVDQDQEGQSIDSDLCPMRLIEKAPPLICLNAPIGG
jgi:hypothetical protein